ncbi:MAG: DUF348 domain-containing protein [Streptosporangiales bacterium]|nr:DUF348 domain-containing protein [Streptosporangiales bacterium]
MRRRFAALVLYATTTAVLVGATSAFVILDKQVSLAVDGQTRSVHSFAGTVEDVLASSRVEVGRRDIVAPDPSTKIKDDTQIVVRHSRPLRLTVDGETRRVWVTALTVSEALDQLRVRTENAELSASRSQRLPRSGFELTINTPRKVTIVIDQVRVNTWTTAGSVGELLSEIGIKPGRLDEVNMDLDEYPRSDQVIKIIQVLTEPKVRQVKIPYETDRRPSDDLEFGETKVVQKGKPGVKEVVTAMVMRDGEKIRDVIAQTIKKEPVKEIVKYGTAGGLAGPAAELNWAALAECESGGDPQAVNPAGPYYGLYQFSASTWQSVGGQGVPTDYGPEEQTYRAQLLYQRVEGRWQGQWPVCGSHLFD